MTLLDRFRTQPQKHPDPAVRLAYVEELPISESDQIAAAAREDDDARVRRAAVGKLMDPNVLRRSPATTWTRAFARARWPCCATSRPTRSKG